MFETSPVQSVSVQLTAICYSTRPVTVLSLPFLCHSHHPNVVGGASLQRSQNGGVTADSHHLKGPFWWGVYLPWLSGVLDSVGHITLSKSLPCYCQSRRSVTHTRSDTDTHHLAGWTWTLNEIMKRISKQLQSADTDTVIELEV